MKACFLGFGVVAQAMYQNINQEIQDISIYDPKYINMESNENIKFLKDSNIDYSKYDVIFICVPTSSKMDGNKFDSSLVTNILNKLLEIDYNGIIILKSTVLPIILNEYHTLKLCYWAEFLNDLTATEDFKAETHILVGCDNFFIKKQIEEIILNYWPFIKDITFKSIKDVCSFKIIKNSKTFFDVLFFNIVHLNFDIDNRLLNELLELFPNGSNSKIALDGQLGVGGKCLPKDFEAFTLESPNYRIEDILKSLLLLNKDIRTLK